MNENSYTILANFYKYFNCGATIFLYLKKNVDIRSGFLRVELNFRLQNYELLKWFYLEKERNFHQKK